MCVLVGCGEAEKEKLAKVDEKTKAPAEANAVTWVSDPTDLNNFKIEAAIRRSLNKYGGKLAKADLEKVTTLSLYGNRITDVKGLEKLTLLTELDLSDSPALTKAQIAELQKALPKCEIIHTATK